jgi:hypothetical protein
MNHRETEFPLGKILCESFIIGVLGISERKDLELWSCNDMPKSRRAVVDRGVKFVSWPEGEI